MSFKFDRLIIYIMLTMLPIELFAGIHWLVQVDNGHQKFHKNGTLSNSLAGLSSKYTTNKKIGISCDFVPNKSSIKLAENVIKIENLKLNCMINGTSFTPKELSCGTLKSPNIKQNRNWFEFKKGTSKFYVYYQCTHSTKDQRSDLKEAVKKFNKGMGTE
jgi:hypothetical protein